MTDWTTAFYRQNEWANLAIIDVCRGLTDEQLDATVPGTYGTVRETLRHIVGAEGGYAARLGAEPASRLKGGDPWPGFDALAEMASAAAEVFVASVSGDPAHAIRVGGDDPWDAEAAVIAVQVLNHGTEHRSQIATILTTLGIEPPELSGWEWGIATGAMRRP
jgi:uncharacterized damage-inducible protein DinB